MITTVIVQYLLIQYGGLAVKCVPLTYQQHLICVGIGAFSLVIGFVAKLIPLSFFSCLRVSEEPGADDYRLKKSLTKSFRQSRALSKQGSKKKVHDSPRGDD